MASPVTSPLPIDNLAELLERLGNVPLERIRFRPAPGTATEDDVLTALEAPRKRICELIDGVLVEKAMGFRESCLTVILIQILQRFVSSRNLGLVTAPDGTIRLWAGRVRIPDIAFFSWDHLPGRRLPDEPIPMLAPNLAIEVLSRSNTPAEMHRKREDYFSAGVQLVWEIDPETRTLHVYTEPEHAAAVVTEDGTLDGGMILPGFTLPLRPLFAELDRQG
jgi:Uma2 family endonuclease